MFKRSRLENSPMSHPLQYIHAPLFRDHHREPSIIRSFSPPNSFPPFHVIDAGFIKALLWWVTSCRHQLIIQEVDLETTPFSTLKLACLNGKFLTFNDRFTSMTFDRKILHGVWHEVSFSHHANCTVVPWRSSSLSVIPLAHVNILHHSLVIRRCISMFDSRIFFTWIDLYFGRRLDEFEDPRSSFIHSGCDIFRNIKTSNVHHCWTDDNPNQRMMTPSESSVCYTDGCLSYVHENEFIKLSMGMPTSTRSWKVLWR